MQQFDALRRERADGNGIAGMHDGISAFGAQGPQRCFQGRQIPMRIRDHADFHVRSL
jgi:hypothetical protein